MLDRLSCDDRDAEGVGRKSREAYFDLGGSGGYVGDQVLSGRVGVGAVGSRPEYAQGCRQRRASAIGDVTSDATILSAERARYEHDAK